MNRTDLHDYQRYCVDFVKNHPESMLILEMGLGKSIISLTAILDLMFDSFEVSKTLVIAPLRVANTVWPEECRKWEHVSFLNMSVMTGDLKNRVAALRKNADVYVINRENVSWLVAGFAEGSVAYFTDCRAHRHAGRERPSGSLGGDLFDRPWRTAGKIHFPVPGYLFFSGVQESVFRPGVFLGAASVRGAGDIPEDIGYRGVHEEPGLSEYAGMCPGGSSGGNG